MSEKEDQQLASIFNEVNRLIRKNGLMKGLMMLKSVNNGKSVEEIEIYECIISEIKENFSVTDKQLFDNNEKFNPCDARRSAYVLIDTYLKHTHQDIATQFGKVRSAISNEIANFKKMENDTFYVSYIQTHRKAEEKITKFIDKKIKTKA